MQMGLSCHWSFYYRISHDPPGELVEFITLLI